MPQMEINYYICKNINKPGKHIHHNVKMIRLHKTFYEKNKG